MSIFYKRVDVLLFALGVHVAMCMLLVSYI